MNIERRRQLPELMRHFNLPMIAAEIGVAGGSFSQELLEEGVEEIFCIDNWGHIPNVTGDGNYPAEWHEKVYEEFKNRFSTKFIDRVIELKGLSSEMHEHISNNSLGLIYQDGSHEYEVVKNDLYYYVPKLVSGGIFGLHDYRNTAYGVKQAVDEYVARYGLRLHHIPEDNPLVASVWFQKR